LETYHSWLETEAIPAGGLGPREAERIWPRHIVDSLLFAAGFESPPGELLDVGTGVGLPGIPLAVLWPETVVTLLDRGGRRIRLLHRIVRRLELGNVHIAQGDVFAVADEWEALTFRGSVKATEAVGLSARLLSPPGTAVLGLSRRVEPPDQARDLVSLATALGLNAEIREVGSLVLDDPAWLLIMRIDGGSK
jgi:16S rRNA (guanine527-N7)-methyltransferase